MNENTIIILTATIISMIRNFAQCFKSENDFSQTSSRFQKSFIPFEITFLPKCYQINSHIILYYIILYYIILYYIIYILYYIILYYIILYYIILYYIILYYIIYYIILYYLSRILQYSTNCKIA